MVSLCVIEVALRIWGLDAFPMGNQYVFYRFDPHLVGTTYRTHKGSSVGRIRSSIEMSRRKSSAITRASPSATTKQ